MVCCTPGASLPRAPPARTPPCWDSWPRCLPRLETALPCAEETHEKRHVLLDDARVRDTPMSEAEVTFHGPGPPSGCASPGSKHSSCVALFSVPRPTNWSSAPKFASTSWNRTPIAGAADLPVHIAANVWPWIDERLKAAYKCLTR